MEEKAGLFPRIRGGNGFFRSFTLEVLCDLRSVLSLSGPVSPVAKAGSSLCFLGLKGYRALGTAIHSPLPHSMEVPGHWVLLFG